MLRPLLVLSSVLAVLFATATSFAQTMTISNIRREGTTRIFASEPFDKNQGNSGFNRADCFDDKQIVKFFVGNIPADADHIELWVRNSDATCANTINWPDGTDPQCGRVKSWTRSVANNADITFKPIEVIYAIRNRKHSDQTTLVPTEVCNDTSGATPFEFWFQLMAFKGDRVLGWTGTSGTTGTVSAGEVVGRKSSYDVSGPLPPSDPSLGAGNRLLVANFKSTAGNTTGGDLVGYRAYCFPSRSGKTAVGDAGTAATPETGTTDTGTAVEDGGDAGDAAGDAAGEDGGDADTGTVVDTGSAAATDAAVPANCPANVPFTAGEIPGPELDEFICMPDTNTSSGKLTISGLTNDITYAVALTSSDRHGNPGAFSGVTCGTPKLTNDFYTLYRNGGGTAGGGYCAIGPRGASFGLAGVSLLLALLARFARRHPR